MKRISARMLLFIRYGYTVAFDPSLVIPRTENVYKDATCYVDRIEVYFV